MSKGQIVYTSNARQVKVLMSELERAAFKEVAKLIRKDAKARCPVSPGGGNLKKNIATWVKKKGPEGPHLQIGVYDKARAQRKKLEHAYYSHFVEFGTKKMGAKPFLRPSVFENIDQIRLIQGKYLKEIQDENRARGLINEAEEESND